MTPDLSRLSNPPTRWVRVNRRTGARGDVVSELRDGARVTVITKFRTPGPWHAEHISIQTWCGRQPARILSSEFHRGAEPPAGDRVCGDCLRALRAGQPDTNRNHGRRGA